MLALRSLAKVPLCTVHASALWSRRPVDVQPEWPRGHGSCQGCGGLKESSSHGASRRGNSWLCPQGSDTMGKWSLGRRGDESRKVTFPLLVDSSSDRVFPACSGAPLQPRRYSAVRQRASRLTARHELASSPWGFLSARLALINDPAAVSY